LENKKSRMRYVFFLILCLVFGSCNFEKTIPEKEKLLNQRLQEIDWNEITRYPSFPACDSITDKIEHKKCFFQHITNLLEQRFADTLLASQLQNDTIYVRVTIDTNTTLVFEPQLNKIKSDKYIKIDSLLKVRLQDFPSIEPAQKNGIPIKTVFSFPIIIQLK